MAQKKGGLGKGLGALFTENFSDTQEDGAIIVLDINEITPNKNQPRSIFENESLSQLADSIAEHGVLQPLIVRPTSEGIYQIVAGERRWRASKMAGLSTVPVIIKPLSDEETSVVTLIENLQREDLNPVEEAVGIRQLIEDFGLTQEQAAQELSKSRPAITNSLRLLNLPDDILQMLVEKKLSAGHARALLGIADNEKIILTAQAIVNENLSVRDTEKLVNESVESKKTKKPKGASDPFFKEVELALSSSLGRKIKIKPTKTGGFMEIEFFDKDDLISIAESLDDK